jgi:hypothetical protein
VNSPWVRREINKALEVEKSQQRDGYRVIPLLLPGITPAALENWFPEEPVAVPVEVGPGDLSAAMPGLLAALGKRLPTDFQPFLEPEAQEPVASWEHADGDAERRFSVQVDSDLPRGAAKEAQAAAQEAASELLSLPWELLHDGHLWLFQGRHAVRVRRRLPGIAKSRTRPRCRSGFCW